MDGKQQTAFLDRSCTKKQASEDELIQITKENDDARFPDFDTIQRYVCSATRTEMFVERMNEAIKQIGQHLHQAYSQQYQANTSPLKQEVEKWDTVLGKALRVLGINMSQMQIDIPSFRLEYREVPNEALLPIADDLLNDALQLSLKILNFIKKNNVYGTAYRDISSLKQMLLACSENSSVKLRLKRPRR